ncbi:TldD/PmbA family protein [Wukongibacter sp. M2B1]|uniref:TldD/PmbA family protein n=1 Tax=Wukongibacter sp. M2B1 TaxID=3088895 RepID=UPI003D79A737
MNKRDLAEILFARGKEKGIEDMEAFIQKRKKLNIKVFKGEIDDYSISDEYGLSFRGIYDGKMGYSYTEKIDESSIDMLIKEVIDNAKIIDSDDEEFIFKGSREYKKIDSYNDSLDNISNKEKIEFTKAMEEEALKADERVEAVNYCVYGEEIEHNILLNTKGLSLEEKSNIAYGYISVMVKYGDDIKTASKDVISNNFSRFNAKELALEAVKEGISQLGAESIESDNYPVILRNEASASLLEAYSTIFSAEKVQKGLSMLSGKIQDKIANDIVTLIDDPHMEGGVASMSFDGEGVASQKKKIIENGVLKTYLHNLKSAKKDGVESTGNAYKPSYKSTVSIAPANMYIQEGEQKFDDMVGSIQKGLIITGFQGLHSGVNTVSGDFSLAAHGYLIENGKISTAVNQITVAGNFYEMMKNIIEVGEDLKFTFPGGNGYIGSPSLKISELSISGK